MTYLSFDDRLELGLASLDDMPENQASLWDDQVKMEEELAEEKPRIVAASTEPTPSVTQKTEANIPVAKVEHSKDESAPLCYNCGNQTQRAGSCYVCTSCGTTTGCS